ncbi:hypothetical protein Btru_040283, partial [Bulinus truncatus]
MQLMNVTDLKPVWSDNSTNRGDDAIDFRNIIIGAVMYLVALVTFCGNLLILLAVYVNRSLRTAFNLLIVNLAVADMAVSVTAMSFYTTDKMLGYWPFGSVMCTLWIFCDYGLTFVSVFTLVAISLDRSLMLCLWVPALTVDRLKAYHPEGTCKWDPSENRHFVVVIAMLGHHGPCLTMLIFYFFVFGYLKTKSKVGPMNRDNKIPATRLDVNSSKTEQTTSLDVDGTSGQSTSNLMSYQESADDKKLSNKQSPSDFVDHVPANNVERANEVNNEQKDIYSIQVPGDIALVTKRATFIEIPGQTSNKQSSAKVADSKDVIRANRERKVFTTLTYIIIAYIICWVPFHVVFDITSLDPEVVPGIVYDLTFWLTYVNSTINPFLYNFSSVEFRQTIRRIILRQTKQTEKGNMRVSTL